MDCVPMTQDPAIPRPSGALVLEMMKRLAGLVLLDIEAGTQSWIALAC